MFLVYLVAAVPFGLAVTALFGGDSDLREHGSGNIGATNVARVHGWGLAVPVLALDVAKGLVPVLISAWVWPGWGLGWLALVALVAFLGHVAPVYLAFHGGKGVATGAGAMLALAPLPTSIAVGTWVLVLMVTGRSSLASLVATGVLVVSSALLQPSAVGVALALAMGIVASHTDNIRRLLAGDEQAILRPVRWGRAGGMLVEPEALLERGPGGEGARAPALWREPDAEASDGPAAPVDVTPESP